MALKKNSARQELITAIFNFGYADPATYGVAESAIEMPTGAIIVGGELDVITAWNSGTSASISLGDAALATRFLNAVSLTAVARTPLSLAGFKYLTTTQLLALISQAGTNATAGLARLVVLYATEGRSSFTQGLDYRAAGVPGA